MSVQSILARKKKEEKEQGKPSVKKEKPIEAFIATPKITEEEKKNL